MMRTFRDSDDTLWTVFEVRRQISVKSGDRGVLPGGYNDGWLCFENSISKRRLTQFPKRWREFSDDELCSLLSEALPAPRGTFRLGDDLSDGSTSADNRPD
jgi:hypothetical protein